MDSVLTGWSEGYEAGQHVGFVEGWEEGFDG